MFIYLFIIPYLSQQKLMWAMRLLLVNKLLNKSWFWAIVEGANKKE